MAGMPQLGPNGWQYSQYPSDAERERRCVAIITDLYLGVLDAVEHTTDTRPLHRRMFQGMHPPGMDYLAGNYRGARSGVLTDYNVHVDGHKAVHCRLVDGHMAQLDQVIRQQFVALDALVAQGSAGAVRETVAVVGVACDLMVKFLTIHPYADGNGHIGRFFIWAFLHRYGFHAHTWPLNKRPPDPDYFEHIRNFRAGNREGLIRFVLTHLASASARPAPPTVH